MKKLVSLMIVLVGLSTSAFGLSISVGGNFNAGGTLSFEQQYAGFSTGGGAFVNLDLFLGLGFQGELNISTQKIGVNYNDTSLTINTQNITLFDFPFMVWWNAKLGPIGLGLGAGINFSFSDMPYLSYDSIQSSKLTMGFAAGANAIFYIGRHFGIVVGAHGVFDFTPRFTRTVTDSSTTYGIETSEWKRSSIYGNVGLEFRF